MTAVDWKSECEREREKFQQETLRTSALSRVLLGFVDQHEREHAPGPWAKGCELCSLVGNARAILEGAPK